MTDHDNARNLAEWMRETGIYIDPGHRNLAAAYLTLADDTLPVVEARCSGLEAEVAHLREALRKMHRRAQAAEAIASKSVEQLRDEAERGGPSLGRGLANHGYAMVAAERDAALQCAEAAEAHVHGLLSWLERCGADTTGHPAAEWLAGVYRDRLLTKGENDDA